VPSTRLLDHSHCDSLLLRRHKQRQGQEQMEPDPQDQSKTKRLKSDSHTEWIINAGAQREGPPWFLCHAALPLQSSQLSVKTPQARKHKCSAQRKALFCLLFWANKRVRRLRDATRGLVYGLKCVSETTTKLQGATDCESVAPCLHVNLPPLTPSTPPQ